MAGFMKKFKKKRRLSTELHDRWGDPAISYPNEGSWNQWNQASGFVANASIETPHHLKPDDSRRYGSPSVPPQNGWNDFHPHLQNIPPEPIHDRTNFPRGYFDATIRRRPEKIQRPPVQGLGIGDRRHELRDEPQGRDSMDDLVQESCDEEDEEDEERDTLGDPRGLNYRGFPTGDIPISRNVSREDCGSYDVAAKSPALSITSRMRRTSIQSATTQASSVAGSSRRTSYTATSSVSAPSLPPDTPRIPSHVMHLHEKRPVTRPKTREPEPTPKPTQHEMVPSYDELYG